MLYALAWLALTVSIFILYDVLLSKYLGRGLYRIIATFIIAISHIVLSQLTLGLADLYTRTGVFTANTAFVVCVSMYMYIRQRPVLIQYFNGRMKQKVTFGYRPSSEMSIILCIIGAIVAWVCLTGLIYPPIDFDGNSYHLTSVGYLIQEHNIYDVQTSLPWLNGYPKYGELVQSWLFLSTNRDIFVDMAQVPFAIIGVLAAYFVSRRLGIKRNSAAVSSLLLLATPIIINQLKTTYVDVVMISIFFASIALTFNSQKNRRLTLVLLGLCYGFLFSLKYTGVIFVIGSLAFFAFQNISFYRKRTYAEILKHIAFMFFGILPSLYWYAKNLILYQTPLYPFGLKVLGFSVFQGKTFQEFADAANQTLTNLPNGYLSRIWYVWTEQKDWYGCLYNYDTNFAGLGPIWFIVMLPSILFALYIAYKKKNKSFLILTAIIAAMFIIYPANYYSRYTLFVLLAGIISLGYVLDHLTNKYSKLITMSIIIFSLACILLTNITMCNFSPSMLKNALHSFRAGNYHESANYQKVIGSAFVYIKNSAKRDDLVVYDSSPYFIYPLWNEKYDNRVEYIPSDNEAEWESKVKSLNAQYIFTQNGSRENFWAKNGETTYNLVYKDEQYEVFKNENK